MYRVSAGIETMKPGYKQILIQPHTNKRLEYSRASFESMYGTIKSGWERKNGKITVTVKIPANTNAFVMLPVDDASKVSMNGLPWTVDKSEKVIIAEEGGKKQTGYLIGSGEYIFEFSE
jgi:alpha-L-rhamnosidase